MDLDGMNDQEQYYRRLLTEERKKFIKQAQTQVGQKNEQNVKTITVKKVKKKFKMIKIERQYFKF